MTSMKFDLATAAFILSVLSIAFCMWIFWTVVENVQRMERAERVLRTSCDVTISASQARKQACLEMSVPIKLERNK